MGQLTNIEKTITSVISIPFVFTKTKTKPNNNKKQNKKSDHNFYKY